MKQVSSCRSVNLNNLRLQVPSKLNKATISGIKLRLFILVLFAGLLNLASFSQKANQIRDGKILQGEKWLPFSYPEKADFYVSIEGNDSWSGTLPEPNAAKSDGPFLSIGQAQKAVRELKSKVFFPKDPPVEKRWIGSPHPLGRGKDILIYIRGGHYSLKQPLVFKPADGGERVETNLPTGAFEYHKLKDHYVTYAALSWRETSHLRRSSCFGMEEKRQNMECPV